MRKMNAVWFSAFLVLSCVGTKQPDTAASTTESPGTSTTSASETGSDSEKAAPARKHGNKVIGYFANWTHHRKGCPYGVSDIDPSILTHINFAFAKADPGPKGKDKPNWQLAPFDPADLGKDGQYAQVNALKKKNPELKTLLSVGGWSHNDPPMAWIFTTMAETPDSRAQFIQNSIKYIREHNFDGFDLDWEYPAEPTRGGRSVDTANYTALLKEFRAAIEAEAKASGKPPILLTIAAPAGYAMRGYDIAEIHKYLDWINIMTYDYFGSWDKTTGANAPAPDVGTGIPGSVSVWLNWGTPREKLVLGLATYGRSFAGVADPKIGAPTTGAGPKMRCTQNEGTVAYFEVLELLKGGKYKRMWDEKTKTPIAYNAAEKVWISYDDEKAYETKIEFIKREGLGGGMFWSLDTDDYKNGYPLVSMVYKSLNKK